MSDLLDLISGGALRFGTAAGAEDRVFVPTAAAGPWLAASSVRVDDVESPTAGR